VPRLWDETIEVHRRTVRGAILDTAAALVAEHGLLSVTMSKIAEETGIGRATLYKYFPDAEAVLAAWHDRQVAAHLHHLGEVRDRAGDAAEQLEAVLETYALMSHEHRHGSDLAALLHRGEHVVRARRQLPDELASYCVSALAAAGDLPSRDSVRRLVTVTLAGLHPATERAPRPSRAPSRPRHE